MLCNCNLASSIGIALAIAGVIIIIITILDRSRIIRVTQFNDIGYLIYWI
jgi:hypothetical protein